MKDRDMKDRDMKDRDMNGRGGEGEDDKGRLSEPSSRPRSSRPPRPASWGLGTPIGVRAKAPTTFSGPLGLRRRAGETAVTTVPDPGARPLTAAPVPVSAPVVSDAVPDAAPIAAPALLSPERVFADLTLVDGASRNRRACPHHDEAMIALVGADMWRDYLEHSASCAVADAGGGDAERSRLLHDPVFQPLPVGWSEGALRAKYAGLSRPPTPAEILDRLRGPIWPYRLGDDELARLRALPASSDPGSSLAIWPAGESRGDPAGFSPYPSRQPCLPNPAGMGAWDEDGSARRVPPAAWGATGLAVVLDANTVLSPDGRVPRDPLAVLARVAAMAAIEAEQEARLDRPPDPLHAVRMPGNEDLADVMGDQLMGGQGSGLGPFLFASMAAAVAALWTRAAFKTAEADRLASTLFLRREAELDLLPAGAAWLHRRGERLRVEALAECLRLLPLARQRRSGGAFERLFGEAPPIPGDGLNGAAFDPLAAFPLVAGAFMGLADARSADYHEAWAWLRREAFAGVALAAVRFGVTPGRGRSWSFRDGDRENGDKDLGGHDGDAARELMVHWMAGVGRDPPGRDPGVGEAGLGLLEGRPPAKSSGKPTPRAWGVAAFDPAWGGSPRDGYAMAVAAGSDGLCALAVMTPTVVGMRRDAPQIQDRDGTRRGGGSPEADDAPGLGSGLLAPCEADRLGATLASYDRVERDLIAARRLVRSLDPVRRLRFSNDPWGLWPTFVCQDRAPLDWSRLSVGGPWSHHILAYEPYANLDFPPVSLHSRGCF